MKKGVIVRGIKTSKNSGKFVDLTGQKLGRLTVLSQGERNKSGRGTWLCQCECGKQKAIEVSRLRSGVTRSCGCLKLENSKIQIHKICHRAGKNHACWRGFGEIPHTYFYIVKSKAKERGIIFDLSIEDMSMQFDLQKKQCALTGEQLTFNGSKWKDKTSWTASLDRIDSSKGYTKDNIQWLHKDINLMKLDHSTDDFLKWCHKVINFTGSCCNSSEIVSETIREGA